MFHYQINSLLKTFSTGEEKSKFLDGWAFGTCSAKTIDGYDRKLLISAVESLIEDGEVPNIPSGDGFRVQFEVLEYLSKLYKIRFDGLDFIQAQLDELEEEFKTPSTACRDDALIVKISYEEADTLQYEKYVEFSSIPFSKPRNRFCMKFGSENFIIVQLRLPSIEVNDIVENMDEIPQQMDFDLDADEVRMMLLESIVNGVDDDNVKKLERHKMYQTTMNIDLFEKPLKLFDQEFEFLCCNSTGAITQKYIFVNKKIRENVLDWAFDKESKFNKDKVFLEKRPMVEPLRLSLINSLCVPTITEFSYKEEEQDDKLDTRDGCGLILSDALVGSILEKYQENVFATGDEAIYSAVNVPNGFNDLGKSSDRANDLSYDLPQRIPDNYKPCAFQIRFRGFKGMLITHNSEKKIDKDIYFTKSMKKFEPKIEQDETIMNQLCIVGMALPFRPTILSSEIIYLFSGLCKDGEELFSYLHKILIEERGDTGHISKIFKDVEVAKRLCESRGEKNFSELVDILENEENKAILSTQTFSNYLLTLNVPMPNSAHLYGVADFTGTLEPGEVFIQLSNGSKKTILEGDVLLTKTPALFRSDLRKFKAVNCASKLEHLYDVIVFSTKADKLVPSLMAGADLDGDHFYAFWDKHLIDIIREDVNENKKEPTLAEEACVPKTKVEGEKNAIIQKATDILLVPIQTFKYCTLNHLLEFRRRYIDDFNCEWAFNEENYKVMFELGKAITDTFDAPKHGTWRKWEDLKDILTKIPRFPHYHSSFNSKKSESIYGKLYESMLAEIVKCYSDTDVSNQDSTICLNSHRFLELCQIKSDPDEYFNTLDHQILSKDNLLVLSIKLEFNFKKQSSKPCLWDRCIENHMYNRGVKRSSIGEIANYIENANSETVFILENCLRDRNLWDDNGNLKYTNILQCTINLCKILVKNREDDEWEDDSMDSSNSGEMEKPNYEDAKMIGSVLFYLKKKYNWIKKNKSDFQVNKTQINQILSQMRLLQSYLMKIFSGVKPVNLKSDYPCLTEYKRTMFFYFTECIDQKNLENEYTKTHGFSGMEDSEFLKVIGWDVFVTNSSSVKEYLRKAFGDQNMLQSYHDITIFQKAINEEDEEGCDLELCFKIKNFNDQKVADLLSIFDMSLVKVVGPVFVKSGYLKYLRMKIKSKHERMQNLNNYLEQQLKEYFIKSKQ